MVMNASTNIWYHIEFAQSRIRHCNFDKLTMIQNMYGYPLGVSQDGEFALSIGYYKLIARRKDFIGQMLEQ